MARPLLPPTNLPTKGSSGQAVRGFRSRPPHKKPHQKAVTKPLPSLALVNDPVPHTQPSTFH